MNIRSSPNPSTLGAREFTQFSRIGSEVAPLWSALAYAGVAMPLGLGTPPGSPLSEALLFGIGGGIGLGYFVYESGDFTSLFLATRITTGESGQAGFLHDILSRLEIPFRALTASTPAAAEKKLVAELAKGRPVITQVNARLLPYLTPPATYHSVLVLSFDPEQRLYWIADRAMQALPIQVESLRAARQGEGAPKSRALVVEAGLLQGEGGTLPLERLRAAVWQGLEACMAQLRHGFGPPNFRGNFGLMGLEKWARLLVDARDPRGWPKFFPPGPRLFAALLSAYEQIEHRGVSGALRPLFVSFLEEAAALLELPGLNQAAERYREAAGLWRDLAQALLPDDAPVLAEARRTADRRRASFLERGAAEMESRTETAVGDFPLGPDETSELLAGVHERVVALHSAEEAALEELEKVISPIGI